MKLCISALAFERNYRLLLNNINCVLQAGEVLQVRGANGCGKSTLLRILAGFIEIQTGTVLWNDKCINEYRESYQSDIQYIGHQNGVRPHLTVMENLKLYGALTNIKISTQQVSQVLKALDLYHLSDGIALHLSAGQQRRLALARLLLHPVPLWILDEPTTALDIAGQQLFINMLQQHLNKGGMAVLTAHHELEVKLGIKEIILDPHPRPLPQAGEGIKAQERETA